MLKAASADTNGGKRELPEAMIIALRVSNTYENDEFGSKFVEYKGGITSEYFHSTIRTTMASQQSRIREICINENEIRGRAHRD